MHPYTFDTFVVGTTSHAAFDAAVKVAEGSPNSLVLYGPLGCGKSHLLQAIASTMRSRRPEAAILLMSTREFVDQILQAIRRNSAPEFVGADAILLDDVRFAADTPHIRRETLLQLSQLSALGAQIAVTADEPLPIDGATNVELGYPDFAAG